MGVVEVAHHIEIVEQIAARAGGFPDRGTSSFYLGQTTYAFQFFSIPVNNPGPAADDLNRFLAKNRVLRVDRQWAADGGNSCWCFCVDYVTSGKQPFTAGQPAQSKIDYKAVLEPRDFQVYSRLRALRKEIAEAEGIPLFAVFTNEQLAEMARRKTQTPNGLKEIVASHLVLFRATRNKSRHILRMLVGRPPTHLPCKWRGMPGI
jgi:hypothetical protein